MLVEQPEKTSSEPEPMNGKVAMISGGATGLGRAIGLEFARRGVHVAFNYVELPGRDILEQALLRPLHHRRRTRSRYYTKALIERPRS